MRVRGTADFYAEATTRKNASLVDHKLNTVVCTKFSTKSNMQLAANRLHGKV